MVESTSRLTMVRNFILVLILLAIVGVNEELHLASLFEKGVSIALE